MSLTRDPKGYYIALGIDESADADAIKAAYRNKAKRVHPDFNPSPIAAKQFHRLHEAYETLSDPDKRADYDRPWRESGKKEPPKETRRTEPKPKAKPKTNGAKHADAKPEPTRAEPKPSPTPEA